MIRPKTNATALHKGKTYGENSMIIEHKKITAFGMRLRDMSDELFVKSKTVEE